MSTPKFPLGALAFLGVWCAGLVLGFQVQAADLPPLTTVSGNPRLPGKFVWADLVTDNVPTARTFYAKLFGWKFRDFGGYSVAYNEERPLCGMFQRLRPTDRKAEPRWFGYISVSNIGRAKKEIVKAGGRVLAEAKNMPKRGEQAVFADPEGAIFGVVKSSEGDPEDFLADPGDWIWMQLLGRDARKQAEFYRAVAGYEVAENSRPNRVNDYVLISGKYARATVRAIPQANTHVQPTWLPYVRVKSVRETVALARQLGGQVLVEPRADLLDERAAVIADPTGAALGLLEWSEDILKGTR